jgi:hypothetical protein
MKSLLALLAAAALLPILAHAQQTESPEAQSQNPTQAGAVPRPAGSPSLSGSEAASTVPLPGETLPASPALEKPLPLMPEDIGPNGAAPKGKHGKGAKGGNGQPGAAATPPKATFDVERDIRARIHIRLAETQAEREPQLLAEWYAAHQTTTDPDRRTALIKYYTDLAAAIVKIDPTVATQANNRKQAAIERLHNARLGDEPPPQDPFATPPPPTESQNPPTPDTVDGY